MPPLAKLLAALLFAPALIQAGLSMKPVVNIITVDRFAREHPAIITGTPSETRNAAFLILRGGDTAKRLKVPYRITGTASNGIDYVALRGWVTIPAGQRIARIIINPLEDRIPEGAIPETVILTVKSGPDYILGPNRKAKALITNYVLVGPGDGFTGPGFCPGCPALESRRNPFP